MSRTGFHNGRERGCCHSDAGQGEGLGVSVEVSDGARCFDFVFRGGRGGACIRSFEGHKSVSASFPGVPIQTHPSFPP